MQDFVDKKVKELRRRSSRKDKETVMKIINYLSRLGIEIEEAFSYFSKHTQK